MKLNGKAQADPAAGPSLAVQVDPEPDPVVEPEPDPVVEPDPDPVVEPDPDPVPVS